MATRDLIKKYRYVLISELILILVLAAVIFARKGYSFTLTPEMNAFTPEAALDGYVVPSSDHLLRIYVPEDLYLNRYSLCMYRTHIPFGIYKMYIDYSASYDTSEENTPLVTVITFDETGDTSCYSDDVPLYEHMTRAESRLYIGRGGRDVYSMILLNGNGEAAVDSVSIAEYRPWRLMPVLALLLFFILIDLGLFYFSHITKEKVCVFLLLVLPAVILSVPFFSSYAVFGHDMDFHMYRVGSLGEELLGGQFPVRYMSGAYFGHGYIIDIFYANILLIPSAFIYLLGAPLYAAYNSYLVLVGIVTIIASYHSFKGVFGHYKWGILGTYLYAFSFYRLCNLYVRSDAGELSAMAFLPLIVYGLFRIYTSEKRDYRNCLPFIIGAFGVVQSHILSVLLCIYFIILFCVLNLKKTLKKLPELLFSGAVLLVINAFYLVPVFSSFIGMGMSTKRAAFSGLGESALDLFQLFEMNPVYGISEHAKQMPNEMHFGAGAAAYAGIILLTFFLIGKIAVKKGRMSAPEKTGLICLVSGLIAVFISSHLFPWDFLGEVGGIGALFTSMQFPWRFMEIADVLFCFGAVAGFKLLDECGIHHGVRAAVLLCIGAFLLFTGIIFSRSYVEMYRADGSSARDISMAIRPDWTYFPEGLNRYMSQDTGVAGFSDGRAEGFVRGEAVYEDDSLAWETLTSESDIKEYHLINGSGDGRAILPVFALDNIRVSDAVTGEEIPYVRTEDCKVSIALAAGADVRVRTEYRVPILWRICDLVSLAGIVLLAAYQISGRKKKSAGNATGHDAAAIGHDE
ncbi:MAG: hypothetical protein K6G43_02860 [Lachnospiraceae bacterium]|nr:hypothetical protein [Lachnospiraceae bacterium]